MEINISEAEWEVMRVVWSNNQVTSKLVIEILKEKKILVSVNNKNPAF